MAFTRTLLQLRTSLLVRGGYEGSEDITSAVALEVLNDGLEETYNLCIACDDDYYVKLGTVANGGQFNTVAGQDTYALPSDFYNLRKVEILDSSTRWKKLNPVPLDGANLIQTVDSPSRHYRYRLSNQGLTLYPTPTGVDTLRVYYLPLAPQLAVDTDSVTFDRPVEARLVLEIALRDCLARQNLSTGEAEMKIEKLAKQLRTAADSHDDGEPFYLNPRGPHGDDEDCY